MRFIILVNMGKNIGKNIGKNLTGSYSPRLLAIRQTYAKQSAIDAFKTASRRTTLKTEETALIWVIIKLLTN